MQVPRERFMSSTQRRVVITGIGAISPLGNSKEELWEGLASGQSSVRPLTALPEATGPVSFAAAAGQFRGKIDDFGPLEKAQKRAIRKGLKVMCRESQMGVASTQLALVDAGIAPNQCDPERTGVVFGTDYMLSLPEEFTDGILQCLDEQGRFEFSRWGGEGMPKMSPLWLLNYLPNMPASHLAIYNDFRGPSNSLTMREAASLGALGEAYQIVLRGSADVMLAGATGTRLHAMKTIHAVQQEELADVDGDPARASRPFDRNRTGMVLGEGAATLVVEELSTAEARGATIYGEIVAASSSFVAGRKLVAKRDKAMANVLGAVLQSGGIDASEIGHFNAHGLSTRSSDVEEARAVGEAFGDRAATLPVVAAKANFGNLGAAGGLIELVGSLMAMRHGRLFPVLNHETPDPACPLAVVTEDEVDSGESFVALNVTPQGQAAAVMVRCFA